MEIKKWFKFESDADYVRLAWVAFILPLIVSMTGFTTIAYSEKLYPIIDFCGSQRCWSNFVETFKVPLSTAGISILLGTMALTLRRAFQGAKQIERFDAQEKLTIHLKNKEIFLEEFRRKWQESFGHLTFDVHQIFDHFYPIDRRSGVDADLIRTAFDHLTQTADFLAERLSKLNSADSFPYISEKDFIDLRNHLIESEHDTLISIRHITTVNLASHIGKESFNIKIYCENLRNILENIQKIIEFTLLFDHQQTKFENQQMLDRVKEAIARYVEVASPIENFMDRSRQTYDHIVSNYSASVKVIDGRTEVREESVKKMLGQFSLQPSPRLTAAFEFYRENVQHREKMPIEIIDFVDSLGW